MYDNLHPNKKYQRKTRMANRKKEKKRQGSICDMNEKNKRI